MSIDDLLSEVKREVSNTPTQKINKPQQQDVNDILADMKADVEANKKPELKYLDKFKTQLLEKDFKELSDKIEMWNLSVEEINEELNNYGINV